MESGRIGRARHTSSLYDYVKVHVWLGDQSEPGSHSHVLSRFLIARTLTATQVPFATAVKVALEVKKHLVDNDQLNVSQAQLEATIFKFIRRRGLSEDCIFQYKLLSTFHQRRQALIILLAGSVMCLKSTMASQLSQRMNLGNVLDVDCVARLMLKTDVNGPPSTASDETSLSSLALRYCDVTQNMNAARANWTSDCHRVFQGIKSDLAKCLHDGKSIIVSGFHLNLQTAVSSIRALADDTGRDHRHAPIILTFFVTAADRELLYSLTSSAELRRRIAFLDELVQPSSLYKQDDGNVMTVLAASRASLPALLSSMHSQVLKSIREGIDAG